MSFDGVDWDVEGVNKHGVLDNQFTTKLYDLMLDFSIAAKKHGYLMTIVPPQSYLDVANGKFDMSLEHPAPWRPDFTYSSWNSYAPLLVGRHFESADATKNHVFEGEVFDAVILQVYETSSRLWNDVSNGGKETGNALKEIVKRMDEGWEVKFDRQIWNIPTVKVRVPHEKLVIGLADWKIDTSIALDIDGEMAGKTWSDSRANGLEFRGYAYWDIFESEEHRKLVPTIAEHMGFGDKPELVFV